MSTPYIYRPLSSLRSTRVLLLHPSKKLDAPLKCTVEEISMEEESCTVQGFDALSYVWGENIGSIPLICDGKEIMITVNCGAALRHLRRAKENLALWVDAVCVNQRDLAERSNQVALMGEIFRRANCVVIWLGEGSKKITRCFTRLKLWAAVAKSEWRLKKIRNNRVWGRRVFLSITGNMTAEEYEHVLGNRWAIRVWTVQEQLLASKVKIMCGYATTEWEEFFPFCTEGSLVAGSFDIFVRRSVPNWDQRWTYRDLVGATRLAYFAEMKSPHEEFVARGRINALVYAVITSQLNDASDPKDKLYAMYGLLEDVVPCLPKANYLESREKIYEDFAKATIVWLRHFWLSHLGTGLMNPRATMPTWVPDLDYRCGDRSHNRYTSVSDATYAEDPGLMLIQDSRPGILNVRGYTFATVVATGQRWSSFGTPIFPRLLCFQTWLEFFNLYSTSHGLNSDGYKDTGLPQAFLDLMFFSDDRKEPMSYSMTMERWFRSRQPLSDTSDCRAIVAEVEKDSRKDAFFWRYNLEDSIIFSVSGGTVGSTTGHITTGDVIVLLASSDMLVVLRQQGEHWQYIGPAYVGGMMDNTLWPHNSDPGNMEIYSLV